MSDRMRILRYVGSRVAVVGTRLVLALLLFTFLFAAFFFASATIGSVALLGVCYKAASGFIDDK